MKDLWYFLLIFFFINACSKKGSIDLGNGCRFDDDPVISGDKMILGPYENTYAVDGHVVAYGFDSMFIIAEQKPREFIEERTFLDPKMNLKKSEASYPKNYFELSKSEDSYSPAESAIRKGIGLD
jgi:hypothetical protein